MLKKSAVAATLLVSIAMLVIAIATTGTAESSTGTRTCSLFAAQASPIPEAPMEIVEPEVVAPLPIVKLDSSAVGAVLTLEVSGYTSTEAQTDRDPCIAADLTDICDRKAKGELLCAASRHIPLGSKLHVQGLGPCIVADRLNRRYPSHVDWYFGQDAEGDDTRLRRARNIGRRDRTVTVISIPE